MPLSSLPASLLDGAALAVTIIVFAVLWHLKRSRKAGFGMRVIIATVLGIVLGIIAAGHTTYVAVAGTVWSQVMSAVVVPLLLFSVIASITNLGESVRLRSIATRTVMLLLLNTLTASLLTLALAVVFHVGRGFRYELPQDYTAREVPGIVDTVTGLFPSNLIGDWASNRIVPVVLFALLVAVAYNAVAADEAGRALVRPFKAFVDAGNAVMAKMTQIIVGFTPYAVVSLIASAVSSSDVTTLLPLLLVLVVAYLAMSMQLFLVQPLLLAAFTRLHPMPFFKAFWPAGVVAFTSESSIGTIPVTVRQLRSAGVDDDVASFVAGLGANLGMPGCAGVWPMLLAVFAVNAQGLQYTPAQYAFLVMLTLLVSIGTVGVPGTATITATSLFAAAGLPVAFIALVQPISQIADMGRTALNVAGAANTAVIVAATERRLDMDAYHALRAVADDDDRTVSGIDAGASDSLSLRSVAQAPVAADAAVDGMTDTSGATRAAPDALGSAAPARVPAGATAAVNLLGFTPAAALADDDLCGLR
ncbi:dicarboxylate/amino acid:cation symporter [Bifidobacterium samirii]|uniref:L-cystine uptake protein TcyP n=1 Tax=Bifidobacterium samirii TaxID=2306974 RepID=A0A430FPF2_9BIFI|nr:dicarboxylate/amino acid:cation symporter [Bifidobacterium samirii]RSX54712.1 sodium:dicarboxylate symporter [Bifidobacterium samirii]